MTDSHLAAAEECVRRERRRAVDDRAALDRFLEAVTITPVVEVRNYGRLDVVETTE